MDEQTHYADDATLDRLLKLEEENKRLAAYAEVLRTALAGLAQWEDLALEMAEPPHRTYYLKCIADAKAALAAEGEGR